MAQRKVLDLRMRRDRGSSREPSHVGVEPVLALVEPLLDSVVPKAVVRKVLELVKPYNYNVCVKVFDNVVIKAGDPDCALVVEPRFPKD